MIRKPLPLGQFSMFTKVSQEDLEQMEESRQKKLKKGEVLRYPETGERFVYFLAAGLLKIKAVNDLEKEIIEYVLSPGNLFGEVVLLHKKERPDAYAQASEESIVYLFEKHAYKKWMDRNSDFRQQTETQIGTRMQQLETRYLCQQFKDAHKRVRDLLADMVTRWGTPSNKEYVVRNYFTHEEVSELTSISRQTVSEIFNELKQQKLISYDSRYIRVPVNSPVLKNAKETGKFR